MKTYTVCVRRPNQAPLTYPAVGAHSFDVHADAVDQFGPCAITVKLAQPA